MYALPFLCLAAALAQAPAPTQQASTDSVKKGTISGTVLNAMTKEPLKRAEVTLMPIGAGRSGSSAGSFGPEGPSGTRRVQTDNDGKYTFTDVDAGKYMISGRRTGFLDGRFGALNPRGAGTQLEIIGDQALKDVKVELTPQAIIAGRVLDEEGEPMQGQSVQVLRQQAQRGGRRMMPMGQNMTNDRGEFRIPNVAPGTVYLQISPGRFGPGGPNIGTTDDKPDMGYVTTYYPGTTDPAQAAKLEVTPGSELSGFEFRLQKTRVYKIKGKIVDEATGVPPKNYFVNLQPRDAVFFGMFGQQFHRGNDGTFELRGVAPGSYLLNVQSGGPGGGGGMMVGGGGGPNRMSHSEPVDVTSQNVENMLIRIPPPVKVAGQIVKSGGENQQLDISNVRVMLTPDMMQNFGGRPLTAKEDGTFESDLLSPGKYRIQVVAPNDLMWVESIKYGDQDVLGQVFEISGASSPIRVTVSADGGSVSGNVVNSEDQPATAASIVLVPVDKNRRSLGFGAVRTAEINQNAAYSFKNLAPGKYWLIALDQMEYGFWEDEEQLKKIEGKATTVEVAKQGTQTSTLKLTSMPQ